MSQIGKNFTYYNVAENCHNLQSEFTVCGICDKSVAFLFSSLMGRFFVTNEK